MSGRKSLGRLMEDGEGLCRGEWGDRGDYFRQGFLSGLSGWKHFSSDLMSKKNTSLLWRKGTAGRSNSRSRRLEAGRRPVWLEGEEWFELLLKGGQGSGHAGTHRPLGGIWKRFLEGWVVCSFPGAAITHYHELGS